MDQHRRILNNWEHFTHLRTVAEFSCASSSCSSSCFIVHSIQTDQQLKLKLLRQFEQPAQPRRLQQFTFEIGLNPFQTIENSSALRKQLLNSIAQVALATQVVLSSAQFKQINNRGCSSKPVRSRSNNSSNRPN